MTNLQALVVIERLIERASTIDHAMRIIRNGKTETWEKLDFSDVLPMAREALWVLGKPKGPSAPKGA